MSRAKAIRTIYACAREAGLDEESQRDIYERETGSRSLREMTEAQLAKVAGAFRVIEKPRQQRKSWVAPESRRDLRLMIKLWWLLADAGVVSKDSDDRRATLNAFIRGKTFREKWGEELTEIRFLSAERAREVIEALKAMGKRNKVRTIR